MQKIHKKYPDGTYAIKGVDFSVREGEIHGLIGENGAGKTTLMRILYGSIKPSTGHILIRGNETSLNDPSDAIEKGIGMVQQQFALINCFTVSENIILGTEPTRGMILDTDRAQKTVEALSGQSGLDVDPQALLEGLPIGVKQRVEILKMLFRGAKILILDEPTSVLTPTEVKDFFKILKKLRDQGSTIIFVTHKLKEVLEICDRITVLRAGKTSGVVDAKESTPQLLARMMVGRDIIFTLKKRKVKPKEKLLEVKGFYVRNDKGILSVNNLSFILRAAEILGIAGVEGNGQTELVEALTGLREIEGGELLLMGKKIAKLEPNTARQLGIAYIPADKAAGLINDLSVAENLILGFQSSKPYNARLGMNSSVISKFANHTIETFNIATSNEKARVRYLSGGNQQRVVVARELTHKPKIILAAQPTRGLDVASTEYVRTALLKMREEDKGVLLVTTDLDEALQLSDRLAIIYRGAFMDVVEPEEVTEEQLGLLMGGQSIK